MPEITLKKSETVKRFLDKCWDGIAPAEGFYCPICGQQKKEFLNPVDETLRLADCECERYLKMLKEFYENYIQCSTKENIKYTDLINGYTQPKNENEYQIKKYGLITRDTIREMEIKVQRAGV
jgi:uncharacterized FlgJ-related protein